MDYFYYCSALEFSFIPVVLLMKEIHINNVLFLLGCGGSVATFRLFFCYCRVEKTGAVAGALLLQAKGHLKKILQRGKEFIL